MFIYVDKETKQKSHTNIAAIQPKIDTIQDARSYTSGKAKTKINKTTKSGMFRENCLKKIISSIIFIQTD